LIQQTIGFNKAKVSRFFDVLEKVCLNESGECIIPFTNIYNVDESGFTCVQKSQKIAATNEKKNVGALTSGEKGKTITVVCCISATCTHIPPIQASSRRNTDINKRNEKAEEREYKNTQKKKVL